MKEIASGAGWVVHRQGRAVCVQMGELEFWMNRQTDMARSSALRQICETHPALRDTAVEAMGANW